jgi:predicted transcriptional regulator YdeE
MELFELERDIRIRCVTATSFPEGVLAAHQQLHAIFNHSDNRQFFGISRPENGAIVYRAGVETLDDDTAALDALEILTLKKGTYLSTNINNFMEDVSSIGRTFDQMITDPRIDPQGYCVEMYLGLQDVRCMVRLQSGF